VIARVGRVEDVAPAPREVEDRSERVHEAVGDLPRV